MNIAVAAPATHRLEINGHALEARPGDTVLQAAERAGLAFPHSCRVGSCGSCRCRVVQGAVHERLESAYLLGADEIDAGVVLACQAELRGDVRVAVDAPVAPLRRVSGVVVGQHRLTPDITRLQVRLDAPLDYRAGQFARLSLPDLEGFGDVQRPYSFATPMRVEGLVEFTVRHVEGGALSGAIHQRDLGGHRVLLDGPFGDFWLRPGDGPLLLVAGTSGLSPVLALIEEARAGGDRRDATLYFAGRAEVDLHALDRIKALAAHPGGRFDFVPVLSGETGAQWFGARGRLPDHLPAAVAPGTQAYLCGSPGLVDAARQRLVDAGLPPMQAFADRFTAQPMASPGGAAPAFSALDAESERLPARFWDYLKFLSFQGVGLFAFASLVAGGGWTVAGLAVVVSGYVLGDAFGGDDLSTPRFAHPHWLTLFLWSALPLLALIVFAAVWSVASGDPLGFGAAVQSVTGVDVLASRDASGFAAHAAALALTGLMIGTLGTIPGHELIHRTWDPTSMRIGRWMLAFSFDANFAIEHVHGHHRYVATRADPATAPRGRSVYAHVLISTVRGNVSAWRIEVRRLAKRGYAVWSVRNAVLRGWAMSALLVASAYVLAGAAGALFFIVCGLLGKALLEVVNYMEHYGLVRDPATPVQPRHSWNTNRRVSSWSLFNLTRHSHHHAQGEVAYPDLKPMPDAPLMPSGYLSTILLTLMPPLWFRLMRPRLAHWDRHFASPDERELATRAEQARA